MNRSRELDGIGEGVTLLGWPSKLFFPVFAFGSLLDPTRSDDGASQ